MMEKLIGLEEIAPQFEGIAIFDVDNSGELKDDVDQMIELVLRPVNIQDQVWLKKEIGAEAFQKALSEMDMEVVSRVIYRQLDNESKRKLAPVDIIEIDEDGVESKQTLNGPARLRAGIRGLNHNSQILSSLLRTLGYSYPDAPEENSEKKTVNQTGE